MDRRLFLASTFATAVDLITPKSGEKELILDYMSKDPALFRTILTTKELQPDGRLVSSHGDDGVLLFDAARAWVLPDGRLEVEKIITLDKPGKMELANGKVLDMPYTCPKGLDGKVMAETVFLSAWKVTTLDRMGNTIQERHSERT